LLRARGFPAVRVERLVDALKRSVPTPKIEVIVKRRAGRQVLRDRPPLAAGSEDVHEAVGDLAHIDVTSIAAASGRRNHRLDTRPFPRRSDRLDSAAGCGHSERGFRCYTSGDLDKEVMVSIHA
jgi:hypothetical protein